MASLEPARVPALAGRAVRVVSAASWAPVSSLPARMLARLRRSVMRPAVAVVPILLAAVCFAKSGRAAKADAA